MPCSGDAAAGVGEVLAGRIHSASCQNVDGVSNLIAWYCDSSLLVGESNKSASQCYPKLKA